MHVQYMYTFKITIYISSHRQEILFLTIFFNFSCQIFLFVLYETKDFQNLQVTSAETC